MILRDEEEGEGGILKMDGGRLGEKEERKEDEQEGGSASFDLTRKTRQARQCSERDWTERSRKKQDELVVVGHLPGQSREPKIGRGDHGGVYTEARRPFVPRYTSRKQVVQRYD
jgi:hypothetical protein